MATLSLDASPRTVLGKQVKRLRRSGLVPAIWYGHGLTSQPLQITAKELQRVARQAGSSAVVELRVAGEPRSRNVFLRQLSYDPITREPLHVDLYQVRMDELMTADIPIHITGEAPAVKDEAGIILPLITHLRVRALPGNIPAAITVDISSLVHTDDAIYVRDLRPGADVEVLAEPDEIVTKVNPSKIAAEAVEAPEQPEAAATPESGEGAASS